MEWRPLLIGLLMGNSEWQSNCIRPRRDRRPSHSRSGLSHHGVSLDFERAHCTVGSDRCRRPSSCTSRRGISPPISSGSTGHSPLVSGQHIGQSRWRTSLLSEIRSELLAAVASQVDSDIQYLLRQSENRRRQWEAIGESSPVAH